jgi:hypothetical protein
MIRPAATAAITPTAMPINDRGGTDEVAPCCSGLAISLAQVPQAPRQQLNRPLVSSRSRVV